MCSGYLSKGQGGSLIKGLEMTSKGQASYALGMRLPPKTVVL